MKVTYFCVEESVKSGVENLNYNQNINALLLHFAL